MIRLSHVTKSFGREVVLRDVSAVMKRGEIHGIVGRNGSGKTVLLKCIAGLSRVDRGTIRVGGKVIGVIPDVKLIQERRHPGLTECIETKDMAERKQKMIELADAYVALPGGPGTLDEISEVICLARLGIENKACVLFDTDGYYQALKKIFEEMVEVGFSEKEDFKRVLVSADMDEIERFIEQ